MISERKNSRFTEHPKLLNPLSPNNKKELIGINSIKEENVEDSITFRDCCENVDYDENNKLENNISNEEGEHSTSGCSKSQISSTKSNNSTSEACKIFNKNDNTPIENDDLFKITPHFIKEASLNKNIQLNLGIKIIDFRRLSERYIIYEEKGKGEEYDSYGNNLIYKGTFVNGKRFNRNGKEYDK